MEIWGVSWLDSASSLRDWRSAWLGEAARGMRRWPSFFEPMPILIILGTGPSHLLPFLTP